MPNSTPALRRHRGPRPLHLLAVCTTLLAALVCARAGAAQPTDGPPAAAADAHATEAAVLGCMDFRLVDDAERYFAGRGLRDRYDQLILAGGALGALNEKYPAWNATFWEHLEVAIALHHIHKVILLDHRDCGAYKVILGEDFAKDPLRETVVHAETMRELRRRIREKHPELAVETLLMAVDGTVETIQ